MIFSAGYLLLDLGPINPLLSMFLSRYLSFFVWDHCQTDYPSSFRKRLPGYVSIAFAWNLLLPRLSRLKGSSALMILAQYLAMPRFFLLKNFASIPSYPLLEIPSTHIPCSLSSLVILPRQDLRLYLPITFAYHLLDTSSLHDLSTHFLRWSFCLFISLPFTYFLPNWLSTHCLLSILPPSLYFLFLFALFIAHHPIGLFYKVSTF